MSRETSRNAVIAALKKHGPISTPDLAKKMKLLSATVHWHVMKLHEAGEIHIKFFSSRKSRTHMRVWAAGAGVDAERGAKFERYLYYFGENGSISEEDHRSKRALQELAADIQPFRDPLILMTAGRAP